MEAKAKFVRARFRTTSGALYAVTVVLVGVGKEQVPVGSTVRAPVGTRARLGRQE